MSAEGERPASVFDVQDQDRMVAQIDSVADDDLTSTFFGDSIDEVEGAATRMFDVGIRTLAHDDAPGVAGAFAAAPAPAAEVSSPARQPSTGAPASLQDDEAARRAFVLGGPDAVR